jgi:hypothetical protein
MVVMLFVVVIILFSVAYFYLNSPIIVSFALLISSMVSTIVSFSYYELFANMLINIGRGAQWAHSVCFVLLFILTFVLLRIACDYLVGSNITFGVLITRLTAVICGVLTGVIVSGILIIKIAMMPLSSKWPYARFGNRPPTASNIQNANKSFLNTDGLASGLFSWVSKGSLSSKKSFAVYHADFLNQIHLNRTTPEKGNAESEADIPAKYRSKGPAIIASAKAIKVSKTGLTRREDGRVVVTVDISGKGIPDGGATDKNGRASFTLSQVSLVCKEKSQSSNTMGSGTVIYPAKYISKQQSNTDEALLGELITLDRSDFMGAGRSAQVKIAFDVPNTMRPVLLRFKQNAITGLPAKSTAETAEVAK